MIKLKKIYAERELTVTKANQRLIITWCLSLQFVSHDEDVFAEYMWFAYHVTERQYTYLYTCNTLY